MEYSSAEMSLVLKLNTRCETCKVKMMQIMQNLTGVYSITIDGERGTMKVTGRVNPSSLLGVLEKYGRHGKLKYVRFDGEIKERRQCYFYGEHEYAPYGVIYNNSTYPPPPLGCPQQLWYHEANLSFFPPPAPPPPRPPPLTVPFQAAPPFSPPMASFWHPPPHPPPPFNHFIPRGLARRDNGKLENAHRHCTIM